MLVQVVAMLLNLSAVCPPGDQGLKIGGIQLGGRVTPAALRSLSGDARCQRDGEGAGAGWSSCDMSFRFAGRPTRATILLQPNGLVHSLEFALPVEATPAAVKEFRNEFESSLERRKDQEMLFFAVRQQTALGVFKRAHDEIYVTYTWLEGAWKGP